MVGSKLTLQIGCKDCLETWSKDVIRGSMLLRNKYRTFSMASFDVCLRLAARLSEKFKTPAFRAQYLVQVTKNGCQCCRGLLDC